MEKLVLQRLLLPDAGMVEGLRRQRASLLANALSYIRLGREGTAMDRLRVASDLSGVPRAMLEVELKRGTSSYGM